MTEWKVETTAEFDAWFEALGMIEKVEVDGLVGALKVLGPQLRRPYADTLNGSKYPNMKELRGRTSAAVLRIAFAFDPLQRAVLLIGGDKSGVSERMFYRRLIAKADKLYSIHLRKAEQEQQEREQEKSRERRKGRRDHGQDI